MDLAYYQKWLIDDAWPLWLERGVDWEQRAFVEHLDPDNLACDADFRRLRVAARQIVTFSKAYSCGVPKSGDAVELGLAFLEDVAKLESGGYARLFDLQNKPLDTTLDLYDHTFVLLAFASAAQVGNKDDLRLKSLNLVRYIRANFRHKACGFIESIPPALPRRQNPHMHFLEALLANYETFGDSIFIETAQEIVELFFHKFLCTETATIAEYFTDDLSIEKRNNSFTIEPGHMFEWIWLLQKFGKLCSADACENHDFLSLYKKVFSFADRHAVNPDNGLIFDGLSCHGEILSRGSRIWPQTERIRAELLCREGNETRREQALTSFAIYLENTSKGLWHEQIDELGQSSYPVSRATSLYHLTTGFFSKI